MVTIVSSTESNGKTKLIALPSFFLPFFRPGSEENSDTDSKKKPDRGCNRSIQNLKKCFGFPNTLNIFETCPCCIKRLLSLNKNAMM